MTESYIQNLKRSGGENSSCSMKRKKAFADRARCMGQICWKSLDQLEGERRPSDAFIHASIIPPGGVWGGERLS